MEHSFLPLKKSCGANHNNIGNCRRNRAVRCVLCIFKKIDTPFVAHKKADLKKSVFIFREIFSHQFQKSKIWDKKNEHNSVFNFEGIIDAFFKVNFCVIFGSSRTYNLSEKKQSKNN